MFFKNHNKKAFLAFCTALLMVTTASCGKSEQPNARQMSAMQQQTYENEPEKLKNIESKLESIIEILGGPTVSAALSSGGQGGQSGGPGGTKGSQQSTQQGSRQSTQQQSTQQGSRQSTQQQSTQQGSRQSTQQQSTQQGSRQSTQQQTTKKQSPQSRTGSQQSGTSAKQGSKQMEDAKWNEIGTIISNLHYQWNEFMPEIAKRGAALKLVDNFDSALNNLTKTSLTKNADKTLESANSLYAYIPDIYSLYRVKMSPEVKRMIYYTRSIVIDAAKDNWNQVKSNSDALGKSWSLFRNTLEKEQQKEGEKLDFAIYELKKVSDDKDKHLVDIKGRIVLSNISDLEKSFEQKNR